MSSRSFLRKRAELTARRVPGSERWGSETSFLATEAVQRRWLLVCWPSKHPPPCTLELSAPTQLCRRMAASPARPMGHLLSAGGAQSAEWEGHRGGAQSRKSQSWGGGVGEGRGTPAFRSPVGDPRQAALPAPHKVPLGSPLALASPPPLASPGCPRASICSSYSSATWMAVSQALAGPTLHLGFWSSVLRAISKGQWKGKKRTVGEATRSGFFTESFAPTLWR